jgi:aspartyl/asparaginyl beta-hydroxylase (cupin superfamily)
MGERAVFKGERRTDPRGGPRRRTLARRLRRWLRKRRHDLNRFMARFSLVGDPPVFPRGAFSWTAELEKEWWAIREEADAVVGQAPSLGSVSPDHRRLDEDGLWRSYFLWGYGYRLPDHCEQCPRTAALVERIPGLVSAFFSIHDPGAHLPLHRGVTKGMVTGHLGLHVAAAPSLCRMQVEDHLLHWEEGRMFVFDDTYRHEVWNDGDEPRVILLVHVARPLRWPGALLSWLFFTGLRFSPFVQDLRRHFARIGKHAERRPIHTWRRLPASTS